MLPFDMILKELNIICEVDGIQHFQPVPFFKNYTFEERVERDRFKEAQALANGYSVIRFRQTDSARRNPTGSSVCWIPLKKSKAGSHVY